MPSERSTKIRRRVESAPPRNDPNAPKQISGNEAYFAASPENRPEETTDNQNGKSKRGRPFQPGNQFGKGRPKGRPNKKDLLLREILEDRGPEILNKVIADALEGKRTAQVLCMERLMAPLRAVEDPSEREPILLEIEYVK